MKPRKFKHIHLTFEIFKANKSAYRCIVKQSSNFKKKEEYVHDKIIIDNAFEIALIVLIPVI